MNKVKKLLRDAANKRPQVVLILLTAAEKKLVNHTKTNLNKYIRILSAIECKSPAVHRKKARVVNAQPVEQDGGSGNDQASSESESGEDVIKCSLCDKFYLTEASETRHFKHKHRTKIPCSYKNCNSNFTNPKALENHEKLHSMDPSTLPKCDKCDY